MNPASSTEIAVEINGLSIDMEDHLNTMKPKPNLPCGDLLNGPRKDYFKFCVPLFQASSTGNWEAAKLILEQRPDMVRSAISEDYLTPLHVAASVEETKHMEDFVKNLVNSMEIRDMELQNSNYNTAFSLAAAAGNLNLVKIMLEKNQHLPAIHVNQGMLPLYEGALYGRHNVVNYLYDVSLKLASAKGWTPQSRACLLLRCVDFDIFDHPELASNASILKALARKPHALNRVEPNSIWRIINSMATLIATVAFAVAFTVPGGYNQEHGLPIFLHERTFFIFVIADAISVFSSSTSLLVFLSILTSRQAAMMVTFSASFFLLYHNNLKWVPILIAIFAAMPVIIFAALQLPLLVDMFRSMYDSRYLFKPSKRILYYD
ncbi:hypothetical protein L6452_40206 [Arctium lappa]|uniref:Uncharacterized protein n=1 Tax=Arctium lappa TaxID=4217 RepID=A0ACB8XN26_ARCLA|nr:hypothetical protein L6452_40206 [Arctium lappa]